MVYIVPLVSHYYVHVWEMCSSCGPRKEGLTFADFLPFSDQMTLCHISMFLSIILKNMLHLHYNFNNMCPFLLGNNMP